MQITRALRYVGAKEQPSPSGTMMALRRFRAFWTRFMTDTWNISQRTACMRSSPIRALPELLDTLKEKKIKIAVFSNKPHADTGGGV